MQSNFASGGISKLIISSDVIVKLVYCVTFLVGLYCVQVYYILHVVLNMMHSSIKSGWRQTFSLAKHNESEGRKSRIRRSKEERKAMVESFIKK